MYEVDLPFYAKVLVNWRSICDTTTTRQSPISLLFFTIIRYDFDGCVGFGSDYGNGEKNRAGNATAKKTRLCISPMASSALAESRSSSRADLYKQVGIAFSL